MLIRLYRQYNVSLFLFFNKNVNYSTSAHLSKNSHSISKHVRNNNVPSFGQRAKEATKTTYYTAVVFAGIGAFGIMIYALYKELMSSFSPPTVYSTAVEKLSNDKRIEDLFGGSIKCYGETSRRGRRQHISHMYYEMEGVKGMRLKFYIKGLIREGTVHAEARENSSASGRWEFRYLFAQSNVYPRDVVIVVDNRNALDSADLVSSHPSENL